MIISYLPARQISWSVFWVKKIEGIIHIYEETRENSDERFQSAYVEAVILIIKFGAEEK